VLFIEGFKAGMVSTTQRARRVEYGELFIDVGMLDGWRENAFGISHGAWSTAHGGNQGELLFDVGMLYG
jgi:citrate lyase alpha subunit